MKHLLAFSVFALLLATATPARAGVIWSQTPTGENNYDITGFAQANDFVVTSPSILTNFRVWLADRAQSGVLDGSLDNFNGTLGWALFADAGGEPGALLFSGSDASPVVASTGALDSFGREVFSVDADFNGSPLLGSGTYWLSVRDGPWGSASDGSVVGWTEASPILGSGRANESNEQNPTNWAIQSADTAFQISAQPAGAIPEPATLAVFGLMAAGAFGVRRRVKAKAAV